MLTRVMQYCVSVTELALFPEHFLEVFDLGEEVYYFPADGLNQAQLLEPALGGVLAGSSQVVQIENLVLQVEVQLLVEKPGQVLVDEVVSVVSSGVTPQVVQQVAYRAVAVAMPFPCQGGQRVWCVPNLLRDCYSGGLVDFLLLVAIAVSLRFILIQRGGTLQGW